MELFSMHLNLRIPRKLLKFRLRYFMVLFEVYYGFVFDIATSHFIKQLDEKFSGSGLKAEDLYESKCSDMDDTCPNPDLTCLRIVSLTTASSMI